jgi:hypothetical protein
MVRRASIEFGSHFKDNIDCQRAGDWRFVCAPSKPEVIGGWALFEDSRSMDRLNDYDGFSALALHISLRRKVALGRWVKGAGERLSMDHDVYDVLFLETKGDNVFRRVGVGRVLDGQIIKDFKASVIQELTLI